MTIYPLTKTSNLHQSAKPLENKSQSVFNRDHLQQKKHRASSEFDNFNFLHTFAATCLSEKLADITHLFPNSLYIGSPLPSEHLTPLMQNGRIDNLMVMDLIKPFKTLHSHPSLIADEEQLPFANQTLDLLLCNLNLHQTNDLPGTLIQARRALKPDGLFLGAMLGGETLWQLRASFNHAEQELYAGISPHVHPFADKQQMGALMQRAGFALPVVDSEFVTVTYDNIFKLMRDLRGMAETNIITTKKTTFSIADFFQKTGQYYSDHFCDKDGKIEATFEVIFLTGWGPSSSQQKPQRPGSAKTKLADALNTKEIGTGEKTPL